MAEKVAHFSQGEEIEVGNNGSKGFMDSWYAATVLQISQTPSRSASKMKKKLFVQYQTLMADEQGLNPLKEYVDLSRVRPKPSPPHEEVDRSFQVAEEVETFYNDGWWEGTVTKVLENHKYRVYFRETDEEIEFHRSELRIHRKWIDERWVPPAQEQEMFVTPHDQGRTIDLASPLSLDVATENSPGQEQPHSDENTFQNNDIANPNPSTGDAVKNVAMKKSHSSRKQTMEPRFSKGDLVEVHVDGEICGDAWLPATVLKQMSNNSFLVELQTSHLKSFQLMETVGSQHIRPLPPHTSHVNSFQLLEKVDARYDCRWWSGVITRVLAGGRYIVFFKHQNKLKEFSHTELRFHMDWIDGKWFRDSKEIFVTSHDQAPTESPGQAQSWQVGNTDKNIDLASPHSLDAPMNVTIENSPGQAQSPQDDNTFQNTDMDNPSTVYAAKNVETKKSPSSFGISSKQKTEKRFSKGDLVEVCLDGEACCDTWFPATVLKEVKNNCFLVKFQKLRLQAKAKSLKETVDSRHIRPFPPQTSHVNSYKLLEKVDAFYDGGWWSGLINRVLAGSRYIVFFKHRDEQKEFSHSELRFHMEWINRKWFINSKEISVTPHNEARNKLPGQAQSGQARNTYQNIDLVSPLSLDATKKVATEKSTGQAQTRQNEKTFESTNKANPSSKDSVQDVSTTKKLPYSKTSSKLVNQSSINKTGSPGKAHIVDSANKVASVESPSSFSGEAIKTPMSLIACPVRRMSIGTLSEGDRQNDFTTPTTKGKGTNVEGKRDKTRALAEILLDPSLKGYSNDHPSPLTSGQVKPKNDLENNGSRNHPLVEGSSSHLPNIIDIEEDTVVDSPKIQKLAPQMKPRVQMPRQKRKSLGGDDIKQHEMGRVSKQKLNVFNRRRQHREKVPTTKDSGKGGEYIAGKLQAPDAMIETQTKCPEHTAASRETTTAGVVQTEDTLKEIEIDGTLSDNRHLDQPISMWLGESYLPSIIDEKGVSLANQPTIQAIKAIAWKDPLMRGSELQNPLTVVDNSYNLEHTISDTQPDEAIGDEHNECVMQSVRIDPILDDIPLEDEGLPFIKCSPVWEIVESFEVFRTMPQHLHFRPLEQVNMELREGLAIGSMVNFANIVGRMGKTQLDEPLSILRGRSKSLEDFKAHGFNVQPMQARLEELLRIKEKHGQLDSELVATEEQITEKQSEKAKLETELEEIDTEMRKIQECINELNKKWNSVVMKKEVQGSNIIELKITMDRIKERIQCARLEFNSVVAAPW